MRSRSLLLGLATLVCAGRASAAYTATISGSTVTFTGDAAADTLTFTTVAGQLQHSRFTAGDPGFESDADFDSTTAGVQPLPGTAVEVDAGDGNDKVDASQAPGTIAFTLKGGGGDDVLAGGPGDDVIVGGEGGDTCRGNGGDDQFPWSDGEGSDTIDGGDGTDTASFDESAAASVTLNVGPNADRASVVRPAGAPFVADLGTIEKLTVKGSPGDDAFAVTPLAAVPVAIDGGGAATADVVTIDANGTCPSAGSGSVTIPTRATVAVTNATIAFSNRAPGGALAFGAATYTVGIAAGSFDVPVTRTGGTCGDVSATYTAVGGTALAGGDYSLATGSIAFADGDTVGTFPVQILAGATAGKTIDLVLANPKDGATLGAPSSTEITLSGGEIGTGGGAGAGGSSATGGSGGSPATGGAAGSVTAAGSTVVLPDPPHGNSSGCATSEGDATGACALLGVLLAARARRRRA